MIHTGPCRPWPVDLGCTQCGSLLPEPGQPWPDGLGEVVDKWAMVATRILFNLSGRRWGPSCPVTVRPCRKTCLDGSALTPHWSSGGWYVPYIDSTGAWRNATPCGCGTQCHCGPELCEVRLEGPVHDIVEVRVDGVLQPPEAYRVDAPSMLVRTDDQCWPSCSDLLAEPDQPGAFTVTYRYGLPLDDVAIAAVSELTCQFLAACNLGGADCGPCQLPGNVQRIARQGVTVDLEETASTSIWREGRTGLSVTDAWLASVNPHNIPYPPRVLSPDAPRRPRVTVWQAGQP